MKTKLALLFGIVLSATGAVGQGTLVINPVPVTNGLTGTLADSSIVAALYIGPMGAPEDSLLPVSAASPLIGGYAQFGAQTSIPTFTPGTSVVLAVRAWTAGFPTYEAAIASGLPSVLAGKSALLAATLGGSPTPPPIPTELNFPGFTVYPVPEVPTTVLALLGTVVCSLWRGWSKRLPSRPTRERWRD